MSFEIVETLTRANMPPTAKISYLRSQGRGRPNGGSSSGAKPKLVITIPTTLIGTAKAKTFVLMVGTGADAGKVRIKGAANPTDGVKPTELKHAFVFRFGYVPKLGDDIFDGETRPVRKINDDEYEITVPASWFEPEAETAPSPQTRRSAALGTIMPPVDRGRSSDRPLTGS